MHSDKKGALKGNATPENASPQENTGSKPSSAEPEGEGYPPSNLDKPVKMK